MARWGGPTEVDLSLWAVDSMPPPSLQPAYSSLPLRFLSVCVAYGRFLAPRLKRKRQENNKRLWLQQLIGEEEPHRLVAKYRL